MEKEKKESRLKNPDKELQKEKARHSKVMNFIKKEDWIGLKKFKKVK